MFEWETSTPDSSPSVGSSGESSVFVTGGGTLRSGSLFGVVRVEQDTFEASCRGLIGAGQRVCIRSDCSVAAHAVKKQDWSKLVGDDTAGVFIRGASSSSSSDVSETLFCQPVLPGNCVRSLDWNEIELSPRSLESWQATFASLKHAASESGDGVDLSTAAKVMENTKAEVKFVAMTPNPKRGKRGAQVVVETVEGEEDDDLMGVKATAVSTPQKRRAVPWKEVPDDIGSAQATPSVKVLQGGAWSNLVSNVNTLRMEHEKEGQDRDDVEASIDEEIEKLHVKLSLIHALLGERSAEFGTQSAFEILTHCMTTVRSLQELVTKRLNQPLDATFLSKLEGLDRKVEQTIASSKVLVQEGLDRFFAEHSEFRKQFVNPTLQLLARSTSEKSDPGGKWALMLSDLKKRIEVMEQHGGQMNGLQTSKSSGVSFGWPMQPLGVGTVGTTPAGWSAQPSSTTSIDPNSMQWMHEEFQRMKEEIKVLKTDLKDLQDQAESDAIVVGSIVFPSRGFCVSWMSRHEVASDPHVFVDAVSLLSLATSDISLDEERAANLRATTAKVRDKTPYHTAYIASFSLEVPPLLGKGSDQSVTTNSRALGGVPKYEDFHPPSGREGIHQRILDHVKDGRRSLEQAISDLFAFGTEPASVAHELLLQSKTFWDDLCHWIVRYHQQVQAESEASSHEVWVLISHCVRAVFRSLREARAPGRATNTPAGMLWGTLRAHEVMKEYRQADFSGHPKIALILHEHLIRFATPRSKFTALQTGLEERMEKLQRSVNSAVAAANKNGGKKSSS